MCPRAGTTPPEAIPHSPLHSKLPHSLPIDHIHHIQPIMSAFAPQDDSDTADYSYVSPDPATSTPPVPEQSTSSDPDRSLSNNPLLGNDNPLVSELEQEVLDEYSRLLRNVNQVRHPAQFLCDALSKQSQSLTILRLALG